MLICSDDKCAVTFEAWMDYTRRDVSDMINLYALPTQYVLVRRLRKSLYGEIRMCRDVRRNQTVAVKLCNKVRNHDR